MAKRSVRLQVTQVPAVLVDVSDLSVGETRTFRVPGAQAGTAGSSGDEGAEAFVLRLEDGHFAYLNSCPHWNVDLDLGSARFYDARYDRVVCRNHGALFDPRTGVCVAGPCAGQRLTPLATRLIGHTLEVTVARTLPILFGP